MPLADYLAKNYLSADAPKESSTSKSKKRKRKDKTSNLPNQTAGLTIADDDNDANDWTIRGQDNSDDDDDPTILSNSKSTKFGAGLINPAKKKSKWLKIGAAPPTNSDQTAADAILASAAAEARARDEDDDAAPTFVGNAAAATEDDSQTETTEGREGGGQPTMSSGAHAGLQTAAQVSAALRRKEKEERRAMAEAGIIGAGPDGEGAAPGKAQETIYRDASGRIINVGMKRAEMRAKAAEEEAKKREEEISRRGDVQRREKEDRRRELEDVRSKGVARYADDEGLNRELMEKERWNDPMANLIAGSKGKDGGRVKKGKKSGKTYQGAAEPNRYGIRPGWRWDGVDRGNGFERKWFAARNKARDRQELEYMWQMDE